MAIAKQRDGMLKGVGGIYSVILLIFMRQLLLCMGTSYRYAVNGKLTCAHKNFSVFRYSVLWLTYNTAQVIVLAARIHTC